MEKTLKFAKGRFLVEKRSLDKKVDPGLVTIPGGHVEKGESPEAALVREAKEELGITSLRFEPLCVLDYDARVEKQYVYYFAVLNWTGRIKGTEAEKLFWLRFEERNKLDAGVDQVAIEKYLKKIRQ